MKLMLKDPVIVARKGDLVLLAEAADVDAPEAIAQFWSPLRGYSSVWQLEALRKMITADPRPEGTDPPQPWQAPAQEGGVLHRELRSPL